jgi:hypothetical protein
MGDIITITNGTRIITDGPGEPGDGTGGGSGGTGGGGGPRGSGDLDNKYACGDLIPGSGDRPVVPPPPDPGEDEPGPGDPIDPPDFEGEFDDVDGGDPGGGGPGVPGPGPRPIRPGGGGGGGGGSGPGTGGPTVPGVGPRPITPGGGGGGGGGAGPFTPPGGVAGGTNVGGFGGGAGPFTPPGGTAGGGLFGGGGGGGAGTPFGPPGGTAGGTNVGGFGGGAGGAGAPGGAAGGSLFGGTGGGGGGAGAPFGPPGGVAGGTNVGGFGGGVGGAGAPGGAAGGSIFGGGGGAGGGSTAIGDPGGTAGGGLFGGAGGGATSIDGPGGTAGGTNVGGFGGGAGVFGPPGGTAGGGLLDSGGGGGLGGPATPGGPSTVVVDPGPIIPDDIGGGVVIPGGNGVDGGPLTPGGPSIADPGPGPIVPDDIGSGVLIDGGTTGGGFTGAGPSVLPDDIGGGVVIDGGSSGGGGGTAPGTGTALNGEFLDDEGVNLNRFNNRIASDDDIGIIDPDIAMRSGKKFSKNLVRNSFGRTDIFGEQITEGLLYILKNNNKFSDWSANAIYSIEPTVLLKSLNPEILKVVNNIKHQTGKPLNPFEKASIFLERIIEGDLENLDLDYLRALANKTNNSKYQQFIRSSSGKVNQVAALQLIDQYKYSLDQSALPVNSEARSTVQSYKVFARDVAKYLPIRVSGVDYKYYVNDDDTFIDRSTLQIEDGDYFLCRAGGVITRLPIFSEKDHAYIIDEVTRSRAIELLGGQNRRTFTVSASLDTNIEFNYSLSSSRQNSYVMKLVPSATTTSVPKGLLKKTTVSYELMEASSIEGRRAINNYVRYKSNYLTVNLDDSDLILDYIENGIRLDMEQTDIILDAAKTNKEVPILVRQIPWYLVIVPTNRKDKLLFRTKSKIRNITSDRIVTRSLTTIPKVGGVDTKIAKPQISRKNASLNRLPNAEGEEATQAVYFEYDPSTTFYQQTYESSSGNLVAAGEYTPQRKKTSFRLVKEILDEFKANYVIDTEGSETGVNVFDVFSRLNLTEFNKFSATENGKILLESIKDGLFDGIKVYPAIRNTGQQAANKTRLIQRRATATPDQFPSVKSTKDGEYIVPPTEIARSSTFSIEPLDDLIAKCTEARGITLQ